MAIGLNDNIKIEAGKPGDAKYLNPLNTPYSSINEVNTTIPVPQRHVGLTVNINNVEYWYKLGVTDTNLVLKTVGGQTSNGENISKDVEQTSHGFAVGDVVGYSGSTYVKALADDTFQGETFGLVTQVEDSNNFRVTFAGYVTTLSGATLQANTLYYLSDEFLGELTTSEPIELGHFSKPILYTTTTNEGLVLNYRANLLSTGSTVTGSGSTSGVTNFINLGNGEDIFKSIITTASGETAQFRTIQGSGGANVSTVGDTIIIDVSGATGIIGDPRNDTYGEDGLFPFDTTTPVGFAIDDINEFLATLAPASPPVLRDHFVSGSFVNGKLSFGASKNDIGYANVDGIDTFSSVDINGLFSQSGDRRGITNSNISGIINADVQDGEPDGIPYEDEAFSDGNVGTLVMIHNGDIIDSIDLASTTSSIISTYLDVSEVKFIKFTSGAEFQGVTYRTGTYNLPAIDHRLGYNYLRILHTGTTFSRITNYVDWVYDNDTQDISIQQQGLPQITNITTSGSKSISGVKYNEGGNFDYTITLSNVYRNIYSSSSNAIGFLNKTKVGSLNSISITGDGLSAAGNSTALPNLTTDPLILNPEARDINIVGNLDILENTNVLGTASGTGTIGTDISVEHPFIFKTFSSGTATANGFLIYTENQTIDLKSEDFTGERMRLEANNYKSLPYNSIDGNGYEWTETVNIVTATSTQYNTGMLVFNGELIYPNSDRLNAYGLSNGNFSILINGPENNVNYSQATGPRNYYRLFKSSNANSLSELFIDVTHTGTATDFLTNGSTNGNPVSATDIKMELLIKRGSVGGFSTHGWFNPFSTDGASQEGITIIGSPSHDNGVTSISCIFPPSVRIGDNDLVIMRLFFSSSYSNRISNIEITNI